LYIKNKKAFVFRSRGIMIRESVHQVFLYKTLKKQFINCWIQIIVHHAEEIEKKVVSISVHTWRIQSTQLWPWDTASL